MAPARGLRERKKQQTRALIAQTARRLFMERGFDAVTVGEVASAAEVSEATVFNYFPTKEDLVYQGMEVFEEEMLQAIRDRPVGETVAAAFGRFVLDVRGMLAEGEATPEELASFPKMITESPSLMARERAILARYTDSLAALIAEETGAGAYEITPWVVANALLGMHRALIYYVRRRLLDGPPDRARLVRDLRAEGRRVLSQLDRGLAEYAPKQPQSATRPRRRRRAGRASAARKETR